ncbi:MAG: hypothetical protein SFV23_14865 [Planctomycetaceae bacterium]|nr:hypothetical protein [Planctomycetaceae bacterium]
MSKQIWSISMCLTLTVVAWGCGQSAPAPQPTGATPEVSAAASDLLLREQPIDAQPVAEVRKSAADGVDVTILGRIGGGETPWVEGRAAFTIVDPKLEPCAPGEGCPTPWDYCCSTDQLPANRAMIKVVDAAGDTVEQDARTLLGVKELQTVVVKGKAKRDDAGNLTVLASGVFIVSDTK